MRHAYDLSLHAALATPCCSITLRLRCALLFDFSSNHATDHLPSKCMRMMLIYVSKFDHPEGSSTACAG